MTIQEWGAIGEIIGGVAVLFSLVYLAYQIRQNTHQIELGVKATQLASFDRTVESSNRIRQMLVSNSDVSKLFTRAIQSYRTLDAEDRFRANMLFRVIFSEIHANFVRNETLELGEPIDGSLRFLDGMLANPGIREWLEDVDVDWREGFRTMVNERLEATRDGSPANRYS